MAGDAGGRGSWRGVVMASHRRYTSANADALASGVTYAVLLGIAPVVVLLGAATRWAGSGSLAGTVATAATRALPGPVAEVVAGATHGHAGVGWVAATMVVWSSVRAVRAARTAVRAVCGQRAGSGNPVRDTLRDAMLALALYAVIACAAVLLTTAPAGGGILAVGVSGAVTWGVVLAVMWLLPWPGAGRPSPRATVLAATGAALPLGLLAVVGGRYLSATMSGRAAIYGSAAYLVATAVWIALTVRVVLRALSLASVTSRSAVAPAAPVAAAPLVAPRPPDAPRPPVAPRPPDAPRPLVAPRPPDAPSASRRSVRRHRVHPVAADATSASRASCVPAAAAASPATTAGQALWVVVPALDEAARISDTLDALAAQDDPDFRVVVADNGSSDGTADVVTRWAAASRLPVHVVTEPERGVGAAVDTGVRHAIDHGATAILRTDADSLPRPDWVRTLRRHLDEGAEMVCGASAPRRDEAPTLAERALLPLVTRMLAVYGRHRRAHRDPAFRSPYVLCHGHNLAITTDLYLQCGGAQRGPLEAGSEDVALLNRARRHSDRIVRAEDAVVESSLRRLRRHGIRRTLLWRWDRRWVPADPSEVHVR